MLQKKKEQFYRGKSHNKCAWFTVVGSSVLAYIPSLFIQNYASLAHILCPHRHNACTLVSETSFSMLSLSCHHKMLVTLFIGYSKANQIGWLIRKLLSQFNQVKQSCRQVNKGSEREGPTSLSPEALCKTSALLPAASMPYFEP